MPRLRRAPWVAAIVLFALTLAACGSQVDPETVAQANGGSTGVQGGVAGEPGTEAGGVPGSGGVPGTAGDPGTAAPGTTDPGTGAPGTTDPGAGGAGSGGSGDAPTDPPVDPSTAGDCAGFKNTTGVTDDTITIGNASDISGPVPGLFETSQDAAKAFVAFFNATSDICGRKLELKNYDSRTDAGADQQADAAACDEVFAMVGSTSAFDLGGASTAQGCGIPDLRAAAVTVERNACSVCFGAQSVNTKEFQNSVPDFVLKNYSSSAKKAAFLYINAGAASQNALRQVAAMTRRGMAFPYVQGIEISDFNYAPYVQQLKDNGIEVVFWTGAYQQSVRLRQAMSQQGYAPKLYLRDPTDYNPDYVESGGADVDGTVVYTNFTPFEEAGRNKELSLYLSWLQQVKPGATPQFFGVFAWSAARLFVEQATKLGGKLTRESLIAALRKVNNWTANDLHAPQPVGPKRSGECWRFIQLNDGDWSPVGGSKYTCSGLTSTS